MRKSDVKAEVPDAPVVTAEVEMPAPGPVEGLPTAEASGGELPQEGGATVNHVGAGHADAMEPYGDALANSPLVAVNAPTAGPPEVVAPTGATLPADTHGTDPVGPVVTAEVEPDTSPKMTTIYAPNEAYTGNSASVEFVNGKGQTDKSELVEWFRNRGYKIGDEGDK